MLKSVLRCVYLSGDWSNGKLAQPTDLKSVTFAGSSPASPTMTRRTDIVKMYGPYTRKADKRKHFVLIYANGQKGSL